MTVSGSRVAALPAHLRKRLADAYDTEMLPDAPSPLALRSAPGMRDGTDELVADLAQRMDEVGGLRAVLMVNIQRARGDTSAPEQLVRRFADRF